MKSQTEKLIEEKIEVLNRELEKNLDFVFYDWDAKKIGKDLNSFLRQSLSDAYSAGEEAGRIALDDRMKFKHPTPEARAKAIEKCKEIIRENKRLESNHLKK